MHVFPLAQRLGAYGTAFCFLAGYVSKPYRRNCSTAAGEPRYSTNARASFGSAELFNTTAACSTAAWEFSGTSQYLPLPCIAGATTRESARNPASAFPDWTNCAACAMFSPSTSFDFTLLYMP